MKKLIIATAIAIGVSASAHGQSAVYDMNSGDIIGYTQPDYQEQTNRRQAEWQAQQNAEEARRETNQRLEQIERAQQQMAYEQQMQQMKYNMQVAAANDRAWWNSLTSRQKAAWKAYWHQKSVAHSRHKRQQ